VVIPTYNQADFLKGALQSVLDQTYQDFEVIVVNNYSTDHTLDVIHDAGDPRIQAIDFQNHGVIGAGRNVGIKASQGAYVAFLDSDDTWYPNKLERVADAIEADPQIGLVCHDQVINRDGNTGQKAHYGPPAHFQGDIYDCLLLRGNCVSTSAAVVERRYLDQVGCFSEDPTLVTVEDYDLWLRLARVCRFHFIQDVLGVHLHHAASASSNVQLHLDATLAVLDRHFNQFQGSHRSHLKRATRRPYSNAYYGAARQHQRMGSLRRSLDYYARTLRVHPFHLKAYLGLALLVVDLIMGQPLRKRLVEAIRPGSWPASWIIT